MKLMKKTVAFVLMSLLATGMIACDQKKEKAEVAPAEKTAPAAVEHQAPAPAAEVKAPAAEPQAPAVAEGQAPAEEVMPPAEEEQPADVPSPDSEPQSEEQPGQAPAAAGAPSQH